MVAFNYFYIKKAHMAYEYKRIKTKDDLKEFIAADRQARRILVVVATPEV